MPPDPVLMVKAIVAAAVASGVFVLAAGSSGRPASAAKLNLASVLAIGLGAYAGFYVLGFEETRAVQKVLDRFLTILFPAAITVELVCGISRLPRSVAWSMRLMLTAGVGTILLGDSSYLKGQASNWTVAQVWYALALSAGLLAAVWGLLTSLTRRRPGVSIPLTLVATCLASGVAAMLTGYVSGGESALPLVQPRLAPV